ncbi:hypothetical protein AOQ84DRAFT_392550 [Glonium stellatum]|uniref:Uncharacterized protein n=1 Tax=Glonium stellatum TaxID=574774 RepID=A0A8E2JMZ6_9PEZI|nr:hypothetical protein AOQ84DRAFT_392550 [Glonium stellatum]
MQPSSQPRKASHSLTLSSRKFANHSSIKKVLLFGSLFLPWRLALQILWHFVAFLWYGQDARTGSPGSGEGRTKKCNPLMKSAYDNAFWKLEAQRKETQRPTSDLARAAL